MGPVLPPNLRKKKTTAVVLVEKPKISKRTKKSTRGHISKSSTHGQYVTAVTNPFHPSAEGVRVPDYYAFDTATYKLKGTISVVAPTSTTTGSFALFPHPFLSYVDLQSLNGGVSTTSTIAMQQFTGNTSLWGACAPSTFSGILSDYRVVSCGWKLRVQIPQQLRTGRLIIAPIPLNRDLPPYSALNGVAALPANLARLFGGVPVAVAVSSAILELPGSYEISLPDMDKGDILLSTRPISAASSTFHTPITGGAYNATQTSADVLLATNTTGTLNAYDFSDVLDMSGFAGYLVHFEGVPNATQPIVDIEYIYHLEGTPSISVVATNTAVLPVPSGYKPKENSSSSIYNQALDIITNMPWERFIDAATSNLGITAGNARISY
jgi:hypothetical protein